MSMPLPVRLFALLVAVVAASPSRPADWTLWGGPRRDFRIESADRLADWWPAGGPKKLWERKLGEGYSAIAVRGDTLYTMYRRDAAAWQIFSSDQEVVVALDASTGRTKWEFAYDVSFRSDQGSGPHVMPQLADRLVFSVGATGQLHALNAGTRELVWILSKAHVLSHNAWTIPTLAGTTLYLRDRKIITALDVGANHARPRREPAH